MFPSMALPLFSISFIFFTFFAHKLYQLWLKYKLPPGPFPLPIIGNLYNMEMDRNTHCFDKLSKTYGPIVSVWFGSTLNVVVSNSDYAKEVLKDKDQQLANRHRTKAIDTVTKNGKGLVWADYGPQYAKLKKVSSLVLFSSKRIEALRDIREYEVKAMVESIFMHHCVKHDGEISLALRKFLGLVAFNNITRLVLGKRFLNKDGGLNQKGLEFRATVNDALKLGGPGRVEHIWWLGWISGLTNKAFTEHLAQRDRLFRSFIEELKDCRNKNGGAYKQNFADGLLTLQERNEIDEDTVIALVWDMVTAGMDTTAITVEWAMAELVKNPRVRRRVQEELDRVIGSNHVMTELDITNLPYLQCVTKEALRLHPPTPLMLPHKAVANVKLCGYDIPKGTIVHVNVRAIGCDPKKWSNPLEFRPERFLEEDVDMKGNDFRLLPFGAGRRICPAMQLCSSASI